MGKLVNKKDFVDNGTLKTYSEINGIEVIEETLLTKGVEIAGATKCVSMKYLEATALVIYGLKYNATNKLYVGLSLDRFYLRNGLTTTSGKIKVPIEVYNRVKELNDSYKTNDNSKEE